MGILAALFLSLPVEADIWREAGYRHGAALPKPAPAVKVTDFGAVPGDGRDDTAAFEAALRRGGVIAIPAGEFHLSRRLTARKPGTVLVGAGSTRTFLSFTRSLEELDPRPTVNSGGTPTTEWSWGGGLLVFQGGGAHGPFSALRPARRGSRVVHLAAPASLRAGQEVVIRLQGAEGAPLAEHLYANDAGDISQLAPLDTVQLSNRVVAVSGTEVHLATPLPVSLPAALSPAIALARAGDDFGLRGVGFRLVRSAYAGHFSEEGWNALQFAGVRHAWAEDILFDGVDSGVFVAGAHVTLRGLRFEAGRPLSDEGFAGHHAVSLAGQSHRLEDFTFQTRFHHDITFSPWANGNVVRQGRGPELSLDFHKRGPFANLVTNLFSTDPRSFFRTGGGSGLGRSAGAWNVFWSLRGDSPVDWPGANFAPAAATALVGLDFAGENASGHAVTPLLPGEPADLWLASRGTPSADRWHLFNQPPVASTAGSTPVVGLAPLVAGLSGLSSFDPDGAPLFHRWDLSDGRVLEGPLHAVTFSSPGRHAATLTVTDGAGDSDTVTVPIHVTTRPAAQGTLRVGAVSARWVPSSRTVVRGEAGFRIIDSGGRPLPGVLVTAELAGLENGVVTALTDRSGTALIRSADLPASVRGSLGFRVVDARLDGHAFLPAASRAGPASLRR